MNQLPHAAVCEAISRGHLVLGKALDEDGSQCLVLAVVGCGIGVYEEPLVVSVIHGDPSLV